MNDETKKESFEPRQEFAGLYPIPYAQALLDMMMAQCLHYRPHSAEDIQLTELFRFYRQLSLWLETELRRQE